MEKITAFSLVIIVFAGANAQEQKAPPTVRVLTPAECALITKRSDTEFFIKGPVTIGDITFEESTLTRTGTVNNGIDEFDVIDRSCFKGKPA
jgi:hypothetical protein